MYTFFQFTTDLLQKVLKCGDLHAGTARRICQGSMWKAVALRGEREPNVSVLPHGLACLLASLLITTSATAQINAQEWNRRVTAGWNLGNQFECSAPGQDSESMGIGNPENSDMSETEWGNPVVTRKTIKAIKEAGFNAVRIPVRWQWHITNDKAMTVSKSWMGRIREVVDWCLENDLMVIINTHHDKWLESRPYYKDKEENCQKLALLWLNIATEFNSYDYRVAFAGTNEVHEPGIWGAPKQENLDVQNAYNQIFVDVVRSTGGNNLKRHLLVQTYVCNPDFGINNGQFVVPQDTDGNGNDYLSVEFHFYNPYDYCGECKYYWWGDEYKKYGETSPSNEKTLTDYFDKVVDTWASQGLGICIGEWGVTDHYKGDIARQHENMKYYCKTFVSEARKRGFSTFIWDNNQFGCGTEKFGIFNRHKGMKVMTPWILEGIREGVEIGQSQK